MSSFIKIQNLFFLQYFGRLREGLKKMISINFVENRKGVILAADICNGILWNLKGKLCRGHYRGVSHHYEINNWLWCGLQWLTVGLTG